MSDRECNCPPSVVRCMHLRDRILVLTSSDALIETHQANDCKELKKRPVPAGLFGVAEIIDYETCKCGGRFTIINPLAIYYGPGLSREKADAAFDAASEQIKHDEPFWAVRRS